jgi:hypothetical protein
VGYPHTEREYHQEAANELINEMWTRKQAKTVRKRFWSRMWMLRTIAQDDPDIHDMILHEFSERMALLSEAPVFDGDRDLCGTGANSASEPKELHNGF